MVAMVSCRVGAWKGRHVVEGGRFRGYGERNGGERTSNQRPPSDMASPPTPIPPEPAGYDWEELEQINLVAYS